jgi:hypothetical protein
LTPPRDAGTIGYPHRETKLSDPQTSPKPTLSFSGLGRLGRFGNQVFQYAFLRSVARVSGADYECPPWIGQKLFALVDPPLTQSRQPLIETVPGGADFFDMITEAVPFVEHATGMKSKRIDATALMDGSGSGDLVGFFQCHTQYYLPHKDFIRSTFRPAPYLSQWIGEPMKVLRKSGQTIIALHIRQGDYRWLPQLSYTLVTPPEWWVEWLDKNWSSFEKPVLYVCSDELDSVLDAFRKYNPVTLRDMSESPPPELGGVNADYYRDFYVLSQADVTCVSNSSFSFFAAMLNERAQRFVRPQWNRHERFIDFDPWNSSPRLLAPNRNGVRPISAVIESAFDRGGAAEVLKTLFAYLPAGVATILKMRIAQAYPVSGWRGAFRALTG